MPPALNLLPAVGCAGVYLASLFAADPFRDVDGSRRGCGMMILKTRIFAEAHAIAAGEPSWLHGLRTNKIILSLLNAGASGELV